MIEVTARTKNKVWGKYQRTGSHITEFRQNVGYMKEVGSMLEKQAVRALNFQKGVEVFLNSAMVEITTGSNSRDCITITA